MLMQTSFWSAAAEAEEEEEEEASGRGTASEGPAKKIDGDPPVHLLYLRPTYLLNYNLVNSFFQFLDLY